MADMTDEPDAAENLARIAVPIATGTEAAAIADLRALGARVSALEGNPTEPGASAPGRQRPDGHREDGASSGADAGPRVASPPLDPLREPTPMDAIHAHRAYDDGPPDGYESMLRALSAFLESRRKERGA